MLLIPDWILQNIGEIIRYPTYNPPMTLRTALIDIFPGFGERLSWVITGILILLLIMEWKISTRTKHRGFLWTVSLTLTASLWIGIPTDPGNFLIIFPAIALTFAVWEERWARAGIIFSIMSMLLLFSGIWLIFISTIEQGYQPQQSPVMFIPLPGFMLVMLYWIRWWTFQPHNPWINELISEEDSSI